jgi:hypothetical protein
MAHTGVLQFDRRCVNTTRQEGSQRCIAMANSVSWVQPLSEDPREQRNVRTRLVILAVIGLIALVISAISSRF